MPNIKEATSVITEVVPAIISSSVTEVSATSKKPTKKGMKKGLPKPKSKSTKIKPVKKAKVKDSSKKIKNFDRVVAKAAHAAALELMISALCSQGVINKKKVQTIISKHKNRLLASLKKPSGVTAGRKTIKKPVKVIKKDKPALVAKENTSVAKPKRAVRTKKIVDAGLVISKTKNVPSLLETTTAQAGTDDISKVAIVVPNITK